MQEPMHQITFRYDYAIKHLEGLLKKAILNGNVMLEDANCYKAQIPYNGQMPSCHINHSKHFTSHFNCYEKKSTLGASHNYWGNFKDYYPDGEKSMT